MRSYVEEQRLKWMTKHRVWKGPVLFLYPHTVRQYFNGESYVYAWIEHSNPSLSDYIEIVW